MTIEELRELVMGLNNESNRIVSEFPDPEAEPRYAISPYTIEKIQIGINNLLENIALRKRSDEILAKLHKLETDKRIYDIHYCNAGIGFIFYEPPDNTPDNPPPPNWKDFLTCHEYYSTIEEAIEKEYERRTKKIEKIDQSVDSVDKFRCVICGNIIPNNHCRIIDIKTREHTCFDCEKRT